MAARGSKSYGYAVVGVTLFWLIVLPIMLAPAPGNRPDISGPDPEIFQKIDNLKSDLKGLERAAKQRNCPKEIRYELFTDKSHSMHFSH